MGEPPEDYPTTEAGGATIPRLGLGTAQITGQACAHTVKTALDLGYRHIDTAQEYDNETMVGEGVAAAAVDREDVFITTKLQMDNLHHHDVIESVHESLDRLDVDYLDLLLIHGPHPRVRPEETLDAMVRLREDGHVDHIGVSNFSRSQLRTAMDVAAAPIVTNQVMYHPYRDQSALRRFCADHDVALTAYSPLARGAVVGEETLADVGTRHDKSAAQVALRWLIQQDNVVAIPKSTSSEHLAQNLAVFDFDLTAEDVARIDDLSPGIRRRLAYRTRRAALRFVSFVWDRGGRSHSP